MKHGRSDRAQGYKKNEHQETGGDAHKGYEDNGEERTAEDKEARPVPIGKVSHRGLDNEGEKAAYACDEADLRQSEGEFFDEHRKQGTDKSGIEIPDKMDECQSKDYGYISLFCMFHSATG